jgi:hypothetical protein
MAASIGPSYSSLAPQRKPGAAPGTSAAEGKHTRAYLRASPTCVGRAGSRRLTARSSASSAPSESRCHDVQLGALVLDIATVNLVEPARHRHPAGGRRAQRLIRLASV